MLEFTEQSEDDQKLVELVRKAKAECEPYHSRWREGAEQRYAIYRSYQAFKSDYSQLTPNDKDDFWLSARSTFDDELFIPYGFAIVETTLPRMLSHRPRPLVKPLKEASAQKVEAVRATIDAQQGQINYEVTLADVAKDGLIYGLGVQKCRWRHEEKKRRYLRQATVEQQGGPAYVEDVDENYVCFDDPEAIWVDPFDFFYDPFGYSMDTIDWAIHRTWRSQKYVAKMIESEAWRNVTKEDLEGLSSSGDYDKITHARLEARGYGDINRRSNQLQEVWEYHDREQMVTVLNNEIVVASGPPPFWHGDLPFQIFRPTKKGGELPGIGEIEPMQDLQREMNEMRTSRRRNALLVLQKPFAYWDGLVDPDEVRFGPGALIPTPGDPRELIRPLEVGDIPGSSYQETAEIASDIERVTGISDPVAGGESNAASATTATGMQLIHQAASLRIQQKTRMMEVEVLRETAKQFHELNVQHIRESREVRIEDAPAYDEATGEARPQWKWLKIKPEDIQGEFEFEGGATEPDNIPQMRQDAQLKMQMLGQNPNVDQRKMLMEVMRDLGLKQVESYLAPLAPTFPAIDPNTVGQIMVERLGIPQDMVQEILQAGQVAAMQQGAVATGNQPGVPGEEQSPNGEQAQPAVP